MARLDAEGNLYYHAILIFVFMLLFVALKNIDFVEYRNSPNLTDTQILLLQILYVFILVWIGIITFRGYLIKTPEYATRGVFSLIIVSLGLFIILFNFLWDPLNNTDYAIGGLGTVSMAISGLLITAGMVVYIHIKFTEDRQQKWFIEAVKDTMERMEVSELPSKRRGYAGRRSRRKASKRAKQEFKEPSGAPEETPIPQPSTTPTQASPSVKPGIIKCPNCTVPLKIPDVDRRPLSIRCPHCGSISTIN